ncbi:MAG: hypothetical protein ACRC62_25830 [Microcoleus sp.]
MVQKSTIALTFLHIHQRASAIENIALTKQVREAELSRRESPLVAISKRE